MERKMRVFFPCLVFLLVLGGCVDTGRPRARIQYYTLEYPPPSFSDLRTLPVTLKLARFSVAPEYNTTRIIYEDQAFRRDEYFYHKWRSNPGDLVTYFLARDLRESGLFRAVLLHDSGIPFSYLLEGAVDEFLEQDESDRWNAVLGITVTLVAAREPDVSKMVIFQKSYRVRKVCGQKNPQGLARAMSLSMEEISRRVTNDIYTFLKSRG